MKSIRVDIAGGAQRIWVAADAGGVSVWNGPFWADSESRPSLDPRLAGGAQRLVATDVPIVDIDFQFFTHHHYDHNVDFAQFALVRWDQGAGKNAPLQIYGPKGTELYVNRLFGPGGAFEPNIVARTKHPPSIAV